MAGKSKSATYPILAPTNLAAGAWTPRTAIPEALRQFGYVPDWTAWNPGDLLLTRSPNPDKVSQQIQKFQSLGYGDELALWTHAAVYLGDGLMLCEAQFDPPNACSVIIAKVWEYIGTHHLMLKRSLHAPTPERGWAIAAAAASKLGADYDVGFVAKFALIVCARAMRLGSKIRPARSPPVHSFAPACTQPHTPTPPMYPSATSSTVYAFPLILPASRTRIFGRSISTGRKFAK